MLSHCLRRSGQKRGGSSLPRPRPFGRPANGIRRLNQGYATIGVFGDIHFQDKGLDRINRTGKWIIDEFKARNVDAVICLGDVLNTREQVSVKALSSAISFFNDLAKTVDKPVHIILGNHDQPLKHSSKISSLDVFGMDAMNKAGFHVYRKTTLTSVAGHPTYMIPYHEDAKLIQQEIEQWVAENGKDSLSQVVAFGHLAINGAIQNASNTKYMGDLATEVFAPFRRTFSGHFHLHHSHPHNITYVGAPLQFNFGDAGQERGVCVYDTVADKFEYVVNPHHKQFVKLKSQDVDETLKETPDLIKDAFILVQYATDKLTPQFHDEIRKKLHQAGAQAVFKENLVSQILKESAENIARVQKKGVEDQLKAFITKLQGAFANKAKKKMTEQQTKWESLLTSAERSEALINKGIELVRKSQTSSVETTEGKPFDARLSKLVLTNFMGVQGTVEISFSDMNHGIWMIEGINGAGKSTIFEALVWVHFGEFLRSGMLKDFAINDNCKECTVRLEYANGFIVERSRKRGRNESLKTFQKTADGSKEEYNAEMELGEIKNTQKVLNETLGIDYETFSRSIVLGQNIFSNFVSGSKEQRRDIIEVRHSDFDPSVAKSEQYGGFQEMIGLDKFNQYLATSKEQRIELEKEISVLSASRDEALHQAGRLQSEVSNLEADLVNRKATTTDTSGKKQDIQAEKKKTLEALTEKRTALESAIATAREDEATATKKEVQIDQSAAKEAAGELLMQDKHLRSLSANPTDCPSCGQPISPSHIEKTLKEARDFLAKFSAQFVALQLAVEPSQPTSTPQQEMLAVSTQCLAMRKKLENEMAANLRAVAVTKAKVKELELDLAKVDNELLRAKAAFDNELQAIEKASASVVAQLDVLQTQIDGRNADILNLKEKASDAAIAISKVATEYDMVKFWELAFEKQSKANTGIFTVRSFIFEELVTELNAVIDTYMDQLTASGQRLSVTLTADLDMTEIYAKRSGGERKRTDLAVLFALYEIVRDRSRYHPNFIMLDEVFDALDKGGRAMVGQVLTTLSKRVDNIFVITHTDLATGLSTAGSIGVEMTANEQGDPKGISLSINKI